MDETVKKDIISTLTRVISVLDSKKEEGFMEIKELSNTTIHNSSIFQDEDSISVAVIIYAVSKVVERTGQVDKKLKEHIMEMRKFLVEGHLQNFHRAIRNTILHISKLDGKIKMYIEQVMQQGRIKKEANCTNTASQLQDLQICWEYHNGSFLIMSGRQQ